MAPASAANETRPAPVDTVWEAALFASHHCLDYLTLVIDYDKIQSLTSVAATLALEPFADKWRAFGWSAAEVDGHDHVVGTLLGIGLREAGGM